MEKSAHPQKYDRLSVIEMKQEMLSHFYLEKGIAFTFFMMLKNPARLLSIYFDEDRKRVFNPFRFLLISVAVTTIILINHSGFSETIASIQGQKSVSIENLEVKFNLPIWDIIMRAQELFMSYQNILIFISLPAISWVTWKFFKTADYNFAEHLVINAFVFGTTYWLSAIVAMLTFFSETWWLATYSITAMNFLVATYFYKKIFGKNILKSFIGIVAAFIPIYIIGFCSQIIAIIVMLGLAYIYL